MMLETLFAGTLRDFCKTAAAQAAGLPAPDTPLHYHAMTEQGDLACPKLTVHVERQPQQHPEIAVLTCAFRLTINVARSGTTTSGTTQIETAHDWMRALRAHLSDQATLKTYLDALDPDDVERDRWQPLLLDLEPFYKPETDGAAHQVEMEQLLILTLRILEVT